MNTTTKCKCGKCPADILAIRGAKGLLPFCELPASVPMKREGFASYEAAVAARKPGQKIRSVGGLGTGSPTRFVLVNRKGAA